MLSERDGDGFGAVGGTDLLEERLDMFVDASVGNAELPGDVLVGETAAERFEDFRLTRCQLLDGRVFLQKFLDFGSKDTSALHLHLFSTPSKYARHGRAYFAILLPAGCGVVAADVIGAEPARPGES